MLDGSVLAIMGGTGSFGNAAVQRFLKTEIKSIRIFSRDEKKQHDMRCLYQDERVTFHIGDVRSYESVYSALRGVDYIFHAAALKQVPSCEFFPGEAVRTNILGTENVLRAAGDLGVKKVICLSTDKAVSPINAMGLSKALMEKVMVASSRHYGENETVFCGTRYGNVMASRGSVIPLFVDQIIAGKAITVTDPGMTRFLMLLPEAIELVLYAFEHGRSGEIFVRKAPACTIGQLARCLIELLGRSTELVEIGTRHGEKKHEVLLSREERGRAEDRGEYFRIVPDARDLNYDKYFYKGDQAIGEAEDYSSANTKQLTDLELKGLLLKLDCVQKALL